jgi:pimeloyl-ACP methyl ester carboxylesterase
VCRHPSHMSSNTRTASAFLVTIACGLSIGALLTEVSTRNDLEDASDRIEALKREVYGPFLPVTEDASLLEGRNIVFVNNLGGPSQWPQYGKYAAALARLGATTTEFECGVHFATTDESDPTVQKCVDALLTHVDTTFGTTSTVTIVSHSWGGVPATYAAATLGDRAERTVYYGAAVPNVTAGQGYDVKINRNLLVPWTERNVSSYQYEHLLLGLSPSTAVYWIGDFPEWMFSGEVALPHVDMKSFAGKTSILLGTHDWSAGVTESGGNNYLAQAVRAGIDTVRVLHVPGDHFHLLNDPTSFASYVYYAIRVPQPQ